MGGHVPRTRGDGQGHPLKGVPVPPVYNPARLGKDMDRQTGQGAPRQSLANVAIYIQCPEADARRAAAGVARRGCLTG